MNGERNGWNKRQATIQGKGALTITAVAAAAITALISAWATGGLIPRQSAEADSAVISELSSIKAELRATNAQLVAYIVRTDAAILALGGRVQDRFTGAQATEKFTEIKDQLKSLSTEHGDMAQRLAVSESEIRRIDARPIPPPEVEDALDRTRRDLLRHEQQGHPPQ
jgi:hypothetical protein